MAYRLGGCPASPSGGLKHHIPVTYTGAGDVAVRPGAIRLRL